MTSAPAASDLIRSMAFIADALALYPSLEARMLPLVATMRKRNSPALSR